MVKIAVKIDKVRFFRCGYAAPKNSNFRGVMTSEVFSDYANYTGREEAKEPEKTLEENENTGYLNYTASHHTGYTRSSMGILDTHEKLMLFKKEIAECFKNTGDLAWENVLSLESFDEAEKYGLSTNEDWEAALSKALPKFFKYAGYDPNNMVWWWDYHTNKFHPHVHIIWMEKEKTRERGKLSKNELAALKRFTALELEARKKLVNQIDSDYKMFFENKDLKFKEIIVNVDRYLANNTNHDLDSLFKILPKTGRLQMNSYHMADFKPLIKEIIHDIIQNDDKIFTSYQQWMEDIDLLRNNMNSIQNSDIDSFKANEIERLYTRIGNRILKYYKEEYRSKPENINTEAVVFEKNDSANKNDLIQGEKNSRKSNNREKAIKKHRRHYNQRSIIKRVSHDVVSMIEQADSEMLERFREFLIENGYYDIQI